MRDYGVRPNKRLGQNFIIDRNIVDKIIKFSDLNDDDIALEIGAGVGNITADLAGLAKKVIAVEFDKGFFKAASDLLRGYKNIELLCLDILKFDIMQKAQKAKFKIVGNLPYCITTPVLEYIIKNKGCIKGALLMVQREFGERLLASPGSRLYGSITCYLNYHTGLKLKSIVRRNSFFPQPDVDSVLLYVKILDTPSVFTHDEGLLFKVIRTAFGQRRKTLLSSLSHKNILGLDRAGVSAVLSRADISPDRRPETLSLKEFAGIVNMFPG